MLGTSASQERTAPARHVARRHAGVARRFAGLVVTAVIVTLTQPQVSTAQAPECEQPSMDGCPIAVGQVAQAVLGSVEDVHAWVVRVPTAGALTVALTNLPADYDVYVYDVGGTEVGASAGEGPVDEFAEVPLATPGDYWIYIGSWREDISDLPYTLMASFVPAAPPPPPAPTFPYRLTATATEPNCGLVAVKMFVRDPAGNPINGVKFRIESGSWNATSNPTGLGGSYPPGWSDFTLRGEPFENTWHIWVVDDSGNRFSDTVNFRTTATNCAPGQGGQQVITLTFTRG